eukprot:6608-Pelagococcus_subviridis.AAC.1
MMPRSVTVRFVSPRGVASSRRYLSALMNSFVSSRSRALYVALVPIRPRSRGERRFLRTSPRRRSPTLRSRRARPSPRPHRHEQRLNPAPLLRRLRDPRPVEDAQHRAVLGVLQVIQQLGREQKRLRRVLPRRRVGHPLENFPLVHRVHPLVDLVHDAERRFHRALAAGLPVRVQDVHVRRRAKFHVELESIRVERVASLLELHLPGAPDRGEVVLELLVDVIHELAQLREPRVLHRRDVALLLGQLCLPRLEVRLDGVDLLFSTLEVLQHHPVRAQDGVRLGLYRVDRLVQLFRRRRVLQKFLLELRRHRRFALRGLLRLARLLLGLDAIRHALILGRQEILLISFRGVEHLLEVRGLNLALLRAQEARGALAHVLQARRRRLRHRGDGFLPLLRVLLELRGDGRLESLHVLALSAQIQRLLRHLHLLLQRVLLLDRVPAHARDEIPSLRRREVLPLERVPLLIRRLDGALDRRHVVFQAFDLLHDLRALARVRVRREQLAVLHAVRAQRDRARVVARLGFVEHRPRRQRLRDVVRLLQQLLHLRVRDFRVHNERPVDVTRVTQRLLHDRFRLEALV